MKKLAILIAAMMLPSMALARSRLAKAKDPFLETSYSNYRCIDGTYYRKDQNGNIVNREGSYVTYQLDQICDNLRSYGMSADTDAMTAELNQLSNRTDLNSIESDRIKFILKYLETS